MENQRPQPPELHGSRQLNAYLCLSITFAAATLTLLLRLVARRVTKVSLWFDDYLALLAYLCASVWFGLVIWWLQDGLGLFLNEINTPVEVTLERSRLILWNMELFYAFSLAFAKLAILGFYWRMFRTSNIKLPIKFLAVCAFIWLILRTLLAIFHCVPVAKFWKPSLPGHCAIDDSKFFFGTVLAHLVIDLSILILPVIEVQKLKLPLSQRLGIMGMFGFGIFVCVASVVVLVLSANYDANSTEMPWNVAPIIIWATAEVNLAIVSACLPMLRPIYLIVLGRPLTKASNSNSYGNSYHQGSRSFPTAHKLATLTTHKELDPSETESTRQLATREGSVSSHSEYERGGHGNMTVVVGPAEDKNDQDGIGRSKSAATFKSSRTKASKTNEGENDWSAMGGIVVTNEMSIKSESVAGTAI